MTGGIDTAVVSRVFDAIDANGADGLRCSGILENAQVTAYQFTLATSRLMQQGRIVSVGSGPAPRYVSTAHR